MLAAASEAIIIGFNVRPVGDARAVAEREGVDIRNYSVIYKVLDELRAAMEGMLEPEEVEDSVGKVEIRQIFRASKIGVIAGSYVTDGKVTRGARTRLVRDGTIVYDGEIASLRRLRDDVREVAAGFECGIVLRNFQDVKEGDVLEVYETRKVDRELALGAVASWPTRTSRCCSSTCTSRRPDLEGQAQGAGVGQGPAARRAWASRWPRSTTRTCGSARRSRPR